MTREKWLDLIEKIENMTGITERYEESLGEDVPGKKEVIIFVSPVLGRVKMEWTQKAKTMEEKTIYSNRIGSNVKVDKVYDESQLVSYLDAFKWDDVSNDWQPIEMPASFSF